MSWLSNYVLPKIRVFRGRDVPDNPWRKCPSCEQMLFHRELAANFEVCRHCGHHFRIGGAARLRLLFDGGEWERVALPAVPADPLRFRDRKRYTERLREAQAAPGAGDDALAVGEGRIGGYPAVVAAFEFSFMGGSMGMAVGAAFVAGARAAIADHVPYAIVTAAGGARMQEGILSLMQMPKATVAIAELKEAGLPYLVILADPTTGGVTASYAMLGDVQLAEPGALIGFAGQRVIEQTIREKLPEGFQRAEYLLEQGMIDMVVPRSQLKEKLALLVSYLAPETKEAA